MPGQQRKQRVRVGIPEDKQNAESESDKRAYCAKILLDPIFREVFNNADERVCPREKRPPKGPFPLPSVDKQCGNSPDPTCRGMLTRLK